MQSLGHPAANAVMHSSEILPRDGIQKGWDQTRAERDQDAIGARWDWGQVGLGWSGIGTGWDWDIIGGRWDWGKAGAGLG